MELDSARLQQCSTFLFDIEGTICSISFVKEVLYPFFVKDLPKYIHDKWETPQIQQLCTKLPDRVPRQPDAVKDYFLGLVAADVKDPALKELQGHIWTSGYDSGAITAPLYPDVIPAFRTLKANNRHLAIYSSGSVKAQYLLFHHIGVEHFPAAANGSGSSDTNSGVNFTHSKDDTVNSVSIVKDFAGRSGSEPMFFDTVNAGSKVEKASYTKIVQALGHADTKEVAFFTDNPKEAEASHAAGLYTVVLVRPGNAALPDGFEEQFPVVRNLDGVAAAVRKEA